MGRESDERARGWSLLDPKQDSTEPSPVAVERTTLDPVPVGFDLESAPETQRAPAPIPRRAADREDTVLANAPVVSREALDRSDTDRAALVVPVRGLTTRDEAPAVNETLHDDVTPPIGFRAPELRLGTVAGLAEARAPDGFFGDGFPTADVEAPGPVPSDAPAPPSAPMRFGTAMYPAKRGRTAFVARLVVRPDDSGIRTLREMLLGGVLIATAFAASLYERTAGTPAEVRIESPAPSTPIERPRPEWLNVEPFTPGPDDRHPLLHPGPRPVATLLPAAGAEVYAKLSRPVAAAASATVAEPRFPEPVEEPAPTASQLAGAPMLTVISQPSGALVEVDGRPLGRTPLVVPVPSPGRLEIRLSLVNHEPWTAPVAPDPSGHLNVNVKLRAR